MRILFVVHQFYPEYAGGTEKITYQLAKAAQRAGHFVRILTCRVLEWPTDCRELIVDTVYHGIPVSAFHRLALPHDADVDLPVNPALVQSIDHLLQQEQYDVAHVMHSMRMGSALEAISNFGLPFLMTLTDFYSQCYRINLVNANAELCQGANAGEQCAQTCKVATLGKAVLKSRNDKFRQLLTRASERICPSEYVRDRFLQEYPELEFRVLEHGIDINLASLQSDQPQKEQSESLSLGFVGSFVPEKGLECLISAFGKVRKQNVRLGLYGGFFGAGKYQKKITALVAEDDRITLYPFLQSGELFSALGDLDLLCLPSTVPETFSLVLREAAAACTPALVSNLGAPAQYVEVHQCGRAVAAGDVNAWSEAIEAVCDQPGILADWQNNLPLPCRVEEEAFFYQSLFQKCIYESKNS